MFSAVFQHRVSTHWVAAAAIALAACSSTGDDDDGPAEPSGGTGSGGSSGTGGSTAQGGSSGSAGKGTGGSTGGTTSKGGSGNSTGGTGPGSGGTGGSTGGSNPGSGGTGGSTGGSDPGSGGTGGSTGGSGSGGTGGDAMGGSSGSTGGSGMSGEAGMGGMPEPNDTFPYRVEFVGNITTGNSVDTDGLTYSDYWDQITPENAGKWGSVQPNAGSAFNWTTLDAIYDYAEQNDIVFKQHAFVWGRQQPGGSINEAAVKNWMTEFCRRYPNTKLIDVVNEPPPHTTPSYVNSIGGGTNGNWQWITNSFLWAREACPNATLILNDYNNIEWSGDANHFLDIAKTVLENGAPVDAIGAQAHALDDGGVSLMTVQNFVKRLHDETGLPLYITEMDINTSDDAAQLNLYQRYIPFFRDSGYVKGITIWGWIYGRTWSEAPQSGLVRSGNPRSAMTWLMGELGRPVP